MALRTPTGRYSFGVGAKTRVYISDTALKVSLHKGTAGAWKWRDKAVKSLYFQCVKIAPVNNPLNAMHRGGVVGTYKAGFRKSQTSPITSFRIRGRVWNVAPHAKYVEYGRSSSDADQVFSWALAGRVRARRGGVKFGKLTGFTGNQYRIPGHVYTWHRTSARAGDHIMERAGKATARIHKTRLKRR